MNTPSNHVNDIPMLINLFLNLLLSNISNYLNIFLLFNRIYRPLLVGNDHDCFDFFKNLDFSGRQNLKICKKNKIFTKHDHDQPKGAGKFY